LILTTDGVLEATSQRGEQFGFERMEHALAHGTSRAHDLVTRLLRDVRQYVGEASPYDDLTIIAFGIVDPTGRWGDDPTLSTDSHVALTLREDELKPR
jgi:hypothetical protein